MGLCGAATGRTAQGIADQSARRQLEGCERECVDACAHVRARACVRACVRGCVRWCECVCALTCMHARAHARMRPRMHAPTHARAHARTQSLSHTRGGWGGYPLARSFFDALLAWHPHENAQRSYRHDNEALGRKLPQSTARAVPRGGRTEDASFETSDGGRECFRPHSVQYLQAHLQSRTKEFVPLVAVGIGCSVTRLARCRQRSRSRPHIAERPYQRRGDPLPSPAMAREQKKQTTPSVDVVPR